MLLDEPPLIVLPILASKIGLNEVIILQQMHYWLLDKNKKKEERYKHEGRFWIYNSYPKWQEQFPFFTIRTIRRTIRNLEKRGLVLSRQIRNTNRSKWYTIDYGILKKLP